MVILETQIRSPGWAGRPITKPLVPWDICFSDKGELHLTGSSWRQLKLGSESVSYDLYTQICSEVKNIHDENVVAHALAHLRNEREDLYSKAVYNLSKHSRFGHGCKNLGPFDALSDANASTPKTAKKRMIRRSVRRVLTEAGVQPLVPSLTVNDETVDDSQVFPVVHTIYRKTQDWARKWGIEFVEIRRGISLESSAVQQKMRDLVVTGSWTPTGEYYVLSSSEQPLAKVADSAIPNGGKHWLADLPAYQVQSRVPIERVVWMGVDGLMDDTEMLVSPDPTTYCEHTIRKEDFEYLERVAEFHSRLPTTE